MTCLDLPISMPMSMGLGGPSPTQGKGGGRPARPGWIHGRCWEWPVNPDQDESWYIKLYQGYVHTYKLMVKDFGWNYYCFSCLINVSDQIDDERRRGRAAFCSPDSVDPSLHSWITEAALACSQIHQSACWLPDYQPACAI